MDMLAQQDIPISIPGKHDCCFVGNGENPIDWSQSCVRLFHTRLYFCFQDRLTPFPKIELLAELEGVKDFVGQHVEAQNLQVWYSGPINKWEVFDNRKCQTGLQREQVSGLDTEICRRTLERWMMNVWRKSRPLRCWSWYRTTESLPLYTWWINSPRFSCCSNFCREYIYAFQFNWRSCYSNARFRQYKDASYCRGNAKIQATGAEVTGRLLPHFRAPWAWSMIFNISRCVQLHSLPCFQHSLFQ